MVLDPKNNWIQVDPSFGEDERGEESLIALPEDYKPIERPYRAVFVKVDPRLEYKHGDIVVVPAHIIREVDIRDGTFHLIERSHIMAQLS